MRCAHTAIQKSRTNQRGCTSRKRKRQMQRDKHWWLRPHYIIAHRRSVDSMALLQVASNSSTVTAWPLLLLFSFHLNFTKVKIYLIPSLFISVQVRMRVCGECRHRLPVTTTYCAKKPLKFILYKMQRFRRCTIKIADIHRECCAETIKRTSETILIFLFFVFSVVFVISN